MGDKRDARMGSTRSPNEKGIKRKVVTERWYQGRRGMDRYDKGNVESARFEGEQQDGRESTARGRDRNDQSSGERESS